MINTDTTIKNNNISILGASNIGSAFANFDVYQQIPVGLSKLSIRTLVLDNISAVLYRKVLIAKLFFHLILSRTDYHFVSFNNFIATVAAYFDSNTGSAEWEAETAAQAISRSFFEYRI